MGRGSEGVGWDGMGLVRMAMVGAEMFRRGGFVTERHVLSHSLEPNQQLDRARRWE